MRPVRGDEGQAAAEVALVLPLVAMLLLMLVQVGLIVRDQVLVVHAAREAARAAAVEAGDEAPHRAALLAGGLDRRRLSTEIVSDEPRTAGATVRVRVSYRAATDVPLVGGLLGEPELHATAAMRVEG
jgi:Flp pilus assembly protein TadG